MALPPTADLAALADRVASAARRRASFDAFEVRAESTRGRRHQLDRKGEAQVGYSDSNGVSVRAWRGGAAALAAAHDATEASIGPLLDRVERLVLAGARRGAHTFAPHVTDAGHASWSVDIHEDPFLASDESVAGLMREARDSALRVAPEARVTTSFSCSERLVSAITSAGGRTDLRHYHAGLYSHAIVREKGRVGDYVQVKSGAFGLRDMLDEDIPARLGADAATFALEAARAEAARAGRYRVLVDHHLAGLLAHESFGHLTEFDLVATGWSVLGGRLGERLADARISVVDAPTPPDGGRIGVHVPIDDEGTRATTPLRILDKGILAANMHQRDSARAEGLAPTGNGRALDVRYPPIVRMRNTFIEPGDLTREEAIEMLGDGLYLCGGRGGSPHSDGSFMFTSQRGYRVEKGEIVATVKGPSIVGNILNYLPSVEGLTKDFGMFSNTFGGCGKWDQSFLHVGFGGPHILASDVLVGGHSSAEQVEAPA